MANTSIRSEHPQEFPSQTELELLQLLLEEEGPYPWSLVESESESYFTEVEAGFDWNGWSNDEIAARSQVLFNHLDRVWSTTQAEADAAQPVMEDSLQASLAQRFAMRMPQALLSAIAQQSRQIVQANLSLADQLVECVRDLLSDWVDEDLQVLARPLAYAMRGTQKDEAIEQALAAINPGKWSDLSDIDRARLSLVAARYALAHLDGTHSELDR